MGPRSWIGQLDRRRSYDRFDRPVFLLSAPRSGSTFLFEILRRLESAWTWTHEMDALWWSVFPYQRHAEPSDHVGADELTAERAATLRRESYRQAIWGREELPGRVDPLSKLGLRTIRYLDKTIAHAFHLEVLQRLFPDARYIFLVRDARPTIGSMMQGWNQTGRFEKPALQEALRATGSELIHWAYPAPPGWQDVATRPLVEVCAWSWTQHVQFIQNSLQHIPDDRKTLVFYEELQDNPDALAERLARFCDLEIGPMLQNYLRERPLSRTTVTPPDPDKWRRLYGDQIDQVLPTLAPILTSLGYAC